VPLKAGRVDAETARQRRDDRLGPLVGQAHVEAEIAGPVGVSDHPDAQLRPRVEDRRHRLKGDIGFGCQRRLADVEEDTGDRHMAEPVEFVAERVRVDLDEAGLHLAGFKERDLVAPSATPMAM